MQLVSYNIQYAKGQDGKFSIERIADVIATGDIICLQEVECHLERSGDIDQARRLGELLPCHHWVYGPAIDVDGSGVAADGTVNRRRRSFGNMVLSRWPILSTRTHLLPKVGSVTAPSMQRNAVEAVVDLGHAAVRVYSVHLDHVDSATRLPQAHALMTILRGAPAEGGAFTGRVKDADWAAMNGTPMPRAAIVMGDLNCTYDSPEYAVMIGPDTAKHGRLVPPDGLTDAWVAAGHPEGEGISCPDHGRIDHCFVSSWLAGAVKGITIDTGQAASDHYPVFVDFDETALPTDPLAN